MRIPDYEPSLFSIKLYLNKIFIFQTLFFKLIKKNDTATLRDIYECEYELGVNRLPDLDDHETVY